jgi:hypothetical protein
MVSTPPRGHAGWIRPPRRYEPARHPHTPR